MISPVIQWMIFGDFHHGLHIFTAEIMEQTREKLRETPTALPLLAHRICSRTCQQEPPAYDTWGASSSCQENTRLFQEQHKGFNKQQA